MTIYEKRTKRFFKLVIVLLCLFLSTFTLMACSDKTGEIEKNTSGNTGDAPNKNADIKDEEKDNTNVNRDMIAFEKDNNIYLYDEISKQIKSLGDDSKSKDLLSVSPDKNNIVFRYFDEGKATYPPQVVVYNIKNKSLVDIVVDNKNTQQITELKWINNENILVTGHINPSASGYSVYNVKSKKELLSCVGTIRDISIDTKKLLYSKTPHIFPRPKANLYINDNIIFEAVSDNEEIFDGAMSKDGKILAFRSWVPNEADINGEVMAYLNIATINSDGKGISGLKKISISSDTTGDIKFDNKGTVIIIGDDFIYKLKDNNLIKEQNMLPKKEELSEQQIKGFKQALSKQFPEELISEETLLEDINIWNMVAF
jgi:hypothetical protein